MPEQSSEPIPQDVADAFCAAVLCLPDGDFGGHEPTVGFRGQTELISAICYMASHFKNDQIPDDIFSVLCGYMRESDEQFKNDLASDPSFSTAARCLLHLIERQATRRR